VRQSDNNPRGNSTLFVQLGVALGLCFALVLLLAGTASATYEQVGTFAGKPGPPTVKGVYPEETQLGGVSAMAVNTTGAGGVPVGTIYAATFHNGEVDVARFNPDGAFSERWEILAENKPLFRCGPEGEPAHPVCSLGLSGFADFVKLAVDQSTGDVYVLYRGGTANFPGEGRISVYNADGSALIARFGEGTENHVTTAATPEQIHDGSGIAVGNDGTVYVSDFNYNEFHHRVMVFKPDAPGDYVHYVYSGESHDVSPGGLLQNWAAHPVLDDSGNLYGYQEEAIVEYNPSEPTRLVCKFNQPDGGIEAMTVDPATGEVFYYDYKNKKIHQLSACNAQGEFVETGTIALSPHRLRVEALTFDPSRQYQPSRTPGVLYAGAPTGEGGEPEEQSLGFIFAPPVGLPPSIEGESVSYVTAGSAVLQASINPNSAETNYSFQYITDAAYQANLPAERFTGAVEVPLGGSVLGDGTVALGASTAVSGLAANTEYHYRVVANNCTVGQVPALCTTTGAAQVFHTYPMEAPGLPDGRAYELVSPIEKYGGEVIPENPAHGSCGTECKPGAKDELFPMQSSPNGEAVVYEGTPFSSAGGALKENEYLSRRTASGWQTTTLSPTSQQYSEKQGYEAFDENLTQGLLYQIPSITPDAPSGYPNLYSQPTGTPNMLSPLVSSAPPNRPPGREADKFSIVFAGASSDLSHVFFTANDALTGGTAFAPAAVDGGAGKSNLYEWHGGQLSLVNVEPGNGGTAPGAVLGGNGTVAHAVSTNGSRAFWSSETGQVYVRIDGQTTREIPDHTGKFLTASADGSKVLLSDGRLFGGLEESVPIEELDLTAGKGGFQKTLVGSEDLSSIYFIDEAVLAGENIRGASPVEGGLNLYAWHGGSDTFIATLQDGDIGEHAEASPDGRWLAFSSGERLTGYDNTGPCGNGIIAPCVEDFLYSSETGNLTCVSCNRDGEAPLGNTSLPFLPTSGVLSVVSQPRYLMDSGRLYFDTPNSLTPLDTNGGVEDVYEFEPGGVGGCGDATGCVLLLSAGTGKSDSNFLATDEDGKNVFFTTRDRLVPSDKDEQVDLYDVREGGGFAAEQSSSTKGCSGETCQSASPSPVEAAPGSLAFSGSGDLLAPTPTVASTKTKTKISTKAQALAKALKVCKSKPKKKRIVCERTARKRYAAATKAKRVVGGRKGGRS
jgi:hypothetical protein